MAAKSVEERYREALVRLVALNTHVADLQHEFKTLPPDYTGTPVKLDATSLEAILVKLSDGSMTEPEVTAWAELVEMRDGIEFDAEDTKQLVFDLANPELAEQGWVSLRMRIAAWLDED